MPSTTRIDFTGQIEILRHSPLKGKKRPINTTTTTASDNNINNCKQSPLPSSSSSPIISQQRQEYQHPLDDTTTTAPSSFSSSSSSTSSSSSSGEDHFHEAKTRIGLSTTTIAATATTSNSTTMIIQSIAKEISLPTVIPESCSPMDDCSIQITKEDDLNQDNIYKKKLIAINTPEQDTTNSNKGIEKDIDDKTKMKQSKKKKKTKTKIIAKTNNQKKVTNRQNDYQADKNCDNDDEEELSFYETAGMSSADIFYAQLNGQNLKLSSSSHHTLGGSTIKSTTSFLSTTGRRQQALQQEQTYHNLPLKNYGEDGNDHHPDKHKDDSDDDNNDDDIDTSDHCSFAGLSLPEDNVLRHYSSTTTTSSSTAGFMDLTGSSSHRSSSQRQRSRQLVQPQSYLHSGIFSSHSSPRIERSVSSSALLSQLPPLQSERRVISNYNYNHNNKGTTTTASTTFNGAISPNNVPPISATQLMEDELSAMSSITGITGLGTAATTTTTTDKKYKTKNENEYDDAVSSSFCGRSSSTTTGSIQSDITPLSLQEVEKYVWQNLPQEIKERIQQEAWGEIFRASLASSSSKLKERKQEDEKEGGRALQLASSSTRNAAAAVFSATTPPASTRATTTTKESTNKKTQSKSAGAAETTSTLTATAKSASSPIVSLTPPAAATDVLSTSGSFYSFADEEILIPVVFSSSSSSSFNRDEEYSNKVQEQRQNQRIDTNEDDNNSVISDLSGFTEFHQEVVVPIPPASMVGMEQTIDFVRNNPAGGKKKKKGSGSGGKAIPLRKKKAMAAAAASSGNSSSGMSIASNSIAGTPSVGDRHDDHWSTLSTDDCWSTGGASSTLGSIMGCNTTVGGECASVMTTKKNGKDSKKFITMNEASFRTTSTTKSGGSKNNNGHLTNSTRSHSTIGSERQQESDHHRRCGRRVQFCVVQVRHYERILELNPAVTSGPAIGIGWGYRKVGVVSVDEFEMQRAHGVASRRVTELLMPRHVREHLLKEWGYTQRDIAAATRNIMKTKQSRKVTIQNMNNQYVEEAVERTTRRIKRVLMVLSGRGGSDKKKTMTMNFKGNNIKTTPSPAPAPITAWKRDQR